MSIFAKKPDWNDIGLTPSAPPAGPSPTIAPRGAYGIAEAIQLMRTLPIDQNPDLVVSVVRATLASLNVRLPDIIEDASRKEKATQDRINAVHGQIAELEKQLDVHRKEIAALEADLKETSGVKERLQMAERAAGVTPRPFVAPELPPSPPSPFPLAAPINGQPGPLKD
jgi:hypothetical protein